VTHPDDPVLKALNELRSICFDGGVDTQQGAVKGEVDRGRVADAINGVWEAYAHLPPDSFQALVAMIHRILTAHYPADIFVSRDHADPGVRFVVRLREALAELPGELLHP
jgi:hypothetical protein